MIGNRDAVVGHVVVPDVDAAGPGRQFAVGVNLHRELEGFRTQPGHAHQHLDVFAVHHLTDVINLGAGQNHDWMIQAPQPQVDHVLQPGVFDVRQESQVVEVPEGVQVTELHFKWVMESKHPRIVRVVPWLPRGAGTLFRARAGTLQARAWRRLMGLGIGIVGLPNVGKSTLFNAITKAGAEAANYPFATIDKNVGVVPLQDPRLDALARLYTRGERVPPIVQTAVEFVDIAGLVRGAHKGEGLGNQFLANIREVSAIAHVVRCFDDTDIVHVSGKVDPADDIETINLELALSDLGTLEKRLEKLRKTAKASKDDAELLEVAEKLYEHLKLGQPARSSGLEVPKDFGLITTKPVIYVANVDEAALAADNDHVRRVREIAAREGAEVVKISAQIEGEIADLSDEDARAFLSDLGLHESGLERLVAVGYRALGLITFLTAGEKEVRAWTVKTGTKAPQAAGEIHSDIERGFIRAEVIEWDKLVEAGSIPNAKARGWLRTEGKEYVMQDGDTVNFLFNV